MMSNALTRAMELAKKLPEKDQEALGTLLLEEMRSEQRWAKLFDNSQDQLTSLAEHALAEHQAGLTKRWD